MGERQSSHRRRVGAAVLIGVLVSSPAYAHGGGEVFAEIFLRILLEGMTHPIAPPVPVPTGMPVAAGPIVPLVIPDPEAKVRPDPSLRLKDQQLGYFPPDAPPSFRVRNFTRSFYTMVGGSAKDASQVVQQDGIADPALTVSDDLVVIIARHYGGHDVGLMQPPSAGTEVAPAAASHDPAAPLGTGFALQVNTTHWELKSVSSNPIHVLYGVSHYGVYYDASFQLTDRRDGSILAEGDCDVGPSAMDAAPTYDEAMADGGKQLSDMMQTAAHECARSMAKEYLGIDLPPQAPVAAAKADTQ
jgi:hypothetical protein